MSPGHHGYSNLGSSRSSGLNHNSRNRLRMAKIRTKAADPDMLQGDKA
jgi:hypothetical protein